MLLRYITLAILVCSSFSLKAQQRLYSLQNYYRDRLFFHTNPSADSLATTSPFRYSGSCFFPQTESELFSADELKAEKTRKKWLGRKLFQEHLFDIKGKNYRISIDPLINFSGGKDLRDTSGALLYQNTRGVQVQGEIGKYFSFSTDFRENQQHFAPYQTAYIQAHGEAYPTDSGYVIQNGFVPGAARTKPFKIGAFDYAYATGVVTYAPLKQLRISFGNNKHFIGAGYRSLLLSDNAANFPYLQLSYKINKKLSGEVIYAQQINLLRTLRNSTPEALYEKKGYTVHYFTYQAIPNLSISLFEGTNWNRGDSLQSQRVNGWYYNPMPLLSTAFLGTQSRWSNTVLGLNVLYTAPVHLAFYGQLAVNQLKSFHPAYQIGLRWSEPFAVKNLFFQTEWNSVPLNFYVSPNFRLNYTHNNLPLAHPMGSGFSEWVFRGNYEWKKVFITYQSNVYLTQYDKVNKQFGRPIYALSSTPSAAVEKGMLLLQQVEIGYRFNRSNNLQFFIAGLYRKAIFPSDKSSALVLSIGLRTNLCNRYFDF